MKKKKILIFITHSMGEIDVIFPLLSGIKRKKELQIEILFTSIKIYRQFISSNFYKFCAKKLNLRITKFQLKNKFDYNKSILNKYFIGKLFLRFYFEILKVIKYPILFPKLLQADCYMHEFTNQLDSTSILYWAKQKYNKPIFCYIHGHAINIYSNMNNKIKYSDEVTLLNFHEHNRKTMLKMGYENQYDIGYPKFYKEWQELVKSYPSSQFKGVSTIVIFSRGIHPIYMDKENYINLFVTTFKLIREKLGDILIVIKPHPREDTNFINEILIKNKFNKYVFSNEDASLLATNAFIAISFWTSAILASLASRVPSIEYYIESKRFRESEPRGSVYKKLGIDSVDNAIGLENFIEKVLNKEYQIPPIIGEISKYKNINFVNKF